MSKGYTFVSWKPKGKGRPSSDHICIAGADETLCEIKVPAGTSIVKRGTERGTKKDCDVCRIVMKHIDRVRPTVDAKPKVVSKPNAKVPPPEHVFA